jgi:peptidoglycan/xylan/chitin deacetylase (PgdA/CDA1 family)
MKMLVRSASILALCLAARGIAATLDQTIDREQRFQSILLLPAPDQEIVAQIRDVIDIRYQVHAGAEKFRAEVHQLAKRALLENILVEPTSLDSYRSLRATENVVETMTSDIDYFCARLLQSSKDEKIDVNVRLRAFVALNQIDEQLLSLPFEDQLQIENLLNELRASRMIGDGVFRRSVRLPPAENFDQKSFAMQMKSLEKIIATKAHDKKRFDRAQKILARKMPKMMESLRTSGGVAPRIYPSIDGAGNVEGYHFPLSVVSLTFDDGPDPEYTLPLVDILNSYGAPASFFWLAKNVRAFSSIVDEVTRQGQFSTNCHSWSHRIIARASGAVVQHEVVDAINAEQLAFGRPIRFFRCPGGACSAAVRTALYNMHMIHAYWSIDSLDWLLKDTESIVSSVEDQLTVAKRGIILMHDIHPFSVAAAQQILAWIKQQNESGAMQIRLYTIDDAVELQNKSSESLSVLNVSNPTYKK